MSMEKRRLYRIELEIYGNERFDVYCRKKRVYIPYKDGEELIETSIGQLNFFRWALTNGVIDEIVNNASFLNDEMRQNIKSDKEQKKQEGTRRKRENKSSNRYFIRESISISHSEPQPSPQNIIILS